MSFDIVILAAGRGTRMQSDLPKVLHRLAGQTLLERVVCTVSKLPDASPPVIVYGEQKELLQAAISLPATWAHQLKQLGTAHAVKSALPFLKQEYTLILCGDTPLISVKILENLIQNTLKNTLGILTAHVPNPYGLGRIIRNQKKSICKIIEEKDLANDQKLIQEINTGIYFIPTVFLKKWLPHIKNHNAQKEFYLTDLIHIALQENIPIIDTQPLRYQEILGINTRQQLAELERFLQTQHAFYFMENGVTLLDPARFDARGNIQIGKDTVIDINVILEGDTVIGKRCRIGPHCILRHVKIADDVEIRAHCVLENTTIGSHSIVGPFARIRPDSVLSEKTHVGNFVEIKNSFIAAKSKINHLSYIGDSKIGSNVNIGAGTITCNYDGAYKHQTVIENNVFVGSNSALVAPVTLHEGATIGAGSIITHNAPSHQLTLARVKQKSILNWKRPQKVKKEK